MKNIPLLNLKAQYESIKEEINAAVMDVLESQQFILGDNVKELERAVAKKSGVRYGIGVASGSDALLLSLMAIGVKEGDEVITTPFTFFATVGSIVRLKAKPVFVDIDSVDFNMLLKDVESSMTERTKAILPVHLYGQMIDMCELKEIADRHGIAIVEDAAQAIFAYQQTGDSKIIAGSAGMTGCISFFPSKNLGAYGDGGMIVTNDEKLAELLMQLRVHGSSKQYYHKYVGINSRLDELQAAILGVKLKHIDKWIEARREKADNYRKLMREKGLDEFVECPKEKEGFYHTYHQFTVRVKRNRDALMKYLNENGVSCRVYYPLPLHLQESFASLGYKKGQFPNAEKASDEVLSIPVYPELSFGEQEYIVNKIGGFYGV